MLRGLEPIIFRIEITISIFCICFQRNLCYGVYIPVKEPVEHAAPELEVSCVTGLPARTARPFVPPFFVPSQSTLAFVSFALLPAHLGFGLQWTGGNPS
jgi:hypothetical protein